MRYIECPNCAAEVYPTDLSETNYYPANPPLVHYRYVCSWCGYYFDLERKIEDKDD